MKQLVHLGDGWYSNEELWATRFEFEALPLLTYLSGLVEIIDVAVDMQQRHVILLVIRTDTTRTLFENGAISGERVTKFQYNGRQSISVTS